MDLPIRARVNQFHMFDSFAAADGPVIFIHFDMPEVNVVNRDIEIFGFSARWIDGLMVKRGRKRRMDMILYES